ncbi:head decoration protein [Humibacter sp. RRB41]|uniref:head decoration protein n=1 Tax=Humibacter sp. RRB41 TaxID=2919946 RepID=UPI001FAB1E82|nr:head decoration protein [Humibacter sp. RRB41]
MDYSTLVSSTGGRDQTWLASDHGLSTGQSRTLDVTKFTSGTHYDASTKVLYSGIALAKITASGLYGPYDTTASDGRQLSLDGFLLFEEGLLRPDGSVSAKVAVAVLQHGFIIPANLPIAAQKAGAASDVTAATTAGKFVFES